MRNKVKYGGVLVEEKTDIDDSLFYLHNASPMSIILATEGTKEDSMCAQVDYVLSHIFYVFTPDKRNFKEISKPFLSIDKVSFTEVTEFFNQLSTMVKIVPRTKQQLNELKVQLLLQNTEQAKDLILEIERLGDDLDIILNYKKPSQEYVVKLENKTYPPSN